MAPLAQGGFRPVTAERSFAAGEIPDAQIAQDAIALLKLFENLPQLLHVGLHQATLCRRLMQIGSGHVLGFELDLRNRRRHTLLAAADRLHEPNALRLQDALDALDGVALAIEEMPDALEKVDVVGPVVSSAPAALQGP